LATCVKHGVARRGIPPNELRADRALEGAARPDRQGVDPPGPRGAEADPGAARRGRSAPRATARSRSGRARVAVAAVRLHAADRGARALAATTHIPRKIKRVAVNVRPPDRTVLPAANEGEKPVVTPEGNHGRQGTRRDRGRRGEKASTNGRARSYRRRTEQEPPSRAGRGSKAAPRPAQVEFWPRENDANVIEVEAFRRRPPKRACRGAIETRSQPVRPAGPRATPR
jgi:hypothetical protein